jgi:hypothetical protein
LNLPSKTITKVVDFPLLLVPNTINTVPFVIEEMFYAACILHCLIEFLTQYLFPHCTWFCSGTTASIKCYCVSMDRVEEDSGGRLESSVGSEGGEEEVRAWGETQGVEVAVY